MSSGASLLRTKKCLSCTKPPSVCAASRHSVQEQSQALGLLPWRETDALHMRMVFLHPLLNVYT